MTFPPSKQSIRMIFLFIFMIALLRYSFHLCNRKIETLLVEISADKNNLCRSTSSYENYYDADYFKWQIEHQEFQANHADPTRWGRVQPNFTVLEIGCSSGAVLHRLRCAQKWCIEINSYARKYAHEKYHLKTFRCLGELPNNSIDYAYSVSVLEHVETPILLLRELYVKMKHKGVVEIQVKNEGRQSASNYSALQQWSQKKQDINNHLYTWTPLLLGNLIEGAGFRITRIISKIAAFPPNYVKVRSEMNNEQWAQLLEEEGIKQGVESLTAYAEKK